MVVLKPSNFGKAKERFCDVVSVARAWVWSGGSPSLVSWYWFMSPCGSGSKARAPGEHPQMAKLVELLGCSQSHLLLHSHIPTHGLMRIQPIHNGGHYPLALKAHRSPAGFDITCCSSQWIGLAHWRRLSLDVCVGQIYLAAILFSYTFTCICSIWRITSMIAKRTTANTSGLAAPSLTYIFQIWS